VAAGAPLRGFFQDEASEFRVSLRAELVNKGDGILSGVGVLALEDGTESVSDVLFCTEDGLWWANGEEDAQAFHDLHDRGGVCWRESCQFFDHVVVVINCMGRREDVLELV
jgi:hypothetical protein